MSTVKHTDVQPVQVLKTDIMLRMPLLFLLHFRTLHRDVNRDAMVSPVISSEILPSSGHRR